MTRLKCPHCGTRMNPVQDRNITVDWCPLCHAIWFDYGELSYALRTEIRPQPDPHPQLESALPHRGVSALSCPRCPDAALHTAGWPGVLVAQCTSCKGVSVDRPLLDGLRTRFGHLPPPTSGEITGRLGAIASHADTLARLLWIAIRTVAKAKFGIP